MPWFLMADHSIATDGHGLPQTPMPFPLVTTVWPTVTIGDHGMAIVYRRIVRMPMDG